MQRFLSTFFFMVFLLLPCFIVSGQSINQMKTEEILIELQSNNNKLLSLFDTQHKNSVKLTRDSKQLTENLEKSQNSVEELLLKIDKLETELSKRESLEIANKDFLENLKKDLQKSEQKISFWKKSTGMAAIIAAVLATIQILGG